MPVFSATKPAHWTNQACLDSCPSIVHGSRLASRIPRSDLPLDFDACQPVFNSNSENVPYMLRAVAIPPFADDLPRPRSPFASKPSTYIMEASFPFPLMAGETDKERDGGSSRPERGTTSRIEVIRPADVKAGTDYEAWTVLGSLYGEDQRWPHKRAVHYNMTSGSHATVQWVAKGSDMKPDDKSVVFLGRDGFELSRKPRMPEEMQEMLTHALSKTTLAKRASLAYINHSLISDLDKFSIAFEKRCIPPADLADPANVRTSEGGLPAEDQGLAEE